MDLSTIIDAARYPLTSPDFQAQARARLDTDGVLTLPGFLQDAALAALRNEAASGEASAYFCAQTHSVYLTANDPAFPSDHPKNRPVTSSKGCICDDVVGAASPLREAASTTAKARSRAAASTSERLSSGAAD